MRSGFSENSGSRQSFAGGDGGAPADAPQSCIEGALPCDPVWQKHVHVRCVFTSHQQLVLFDLQCVSEAFRIVHVCISTQAAAVFCCFPYSSCVGELAMDGLWSIGPSSLTSAAAETRHPHLLYCGPFLFFGHGPTDAVGWKEAKARETEDRRVMATHNTDGEAHTLEELVGFFGDRFTGMSEWDKAVPVALWHQRQRQAPRLGSRRVAADKNDNNDETFFHITRALMTLIDEGEVAVAPRRRKVTNAKLLRCALMWTRFVKKCLLFLRNDPTGHFALGA